MTSSVVSNVKSTPVKPVVISYPIVSTSKPLSTINSISVSSSVSTPSTISSSSSSVPPSNIKSVIKPISFVVSTPSTVSSTKSSPVMSPVSTIIAASPVTPVREIKSITAIKPIVPVKPVVSVVQAVKAVVPVKPVVPVVQAAKAIVPVQPKLIASMPSAPMKIAPLPVVKDKKKEKFENSSPYETSFSEGFEQNSSIITEKFELYNSVNMGVTIAVSLVCILGLGYLAVRVARENKMHNVA